MTDGKLRSGTELYSYIDLTRFANIDELETLSAAVRNVLIRHNTDLKQVYRYYSALRCEAENAFELSLGQVRREARARARPVVACHRRVPCPMRLGMPLSPPPADEAPLLPRLVTWPCHPRASFGPLPWTRR